jgi:hypothetical protein
MFELVLTATDAICVPCENSLVDINLRSTTEDPKPSWYHEPFGHVLHPIKQTSWTILPEKIGNEVSSPVSSMASDGVLIVLFFTAALPA